MNAPRAGRGRARNRPAGSHSHTRPASASSHDSHVPQGVGPPAQFTFVSARIRYADRIDPSRPKRMAEVPAPDAATDSELVTSTQPPSPVAYVAWPSGKTGHT